MHAPSITLVAVTVIPVSEDDILGEWEEDAVTEEIVPVDDSEVDVPTGEFEPRTLE